MDLNRHVWEGWTVQAFIDELEYQVNIIMQGQSITKKFENKEELKLWCMDNQPYYKKSIPEVVKYFANKFNLK
jgi:hypothetical protein